MSRYRFADVALDVERFDVTRNGRRLALEPKAIEVLRFLVERPGRLVTKDEILDGVWADVAVTPNALTRVIAQLRRELGDDASAPRVIETVPTRGYRFIAEVHHEPGPAAAVSVPVPAATLVAPRRTARRGARVAALVALAAGVGAALWMVAGREPAPRDDGGGLTALDERGSVLAATFSPDGRWLAVVSDRTGDFEIAVRDLRTGTSRPVTADGMRNVHPVWSPDSDAIAYHSSLRRGIWVMGRDGGAARQVSASGSRPAWSPDGQWIAFQTDEWVSEWAQPGSHIMIVPAGGGVARPLTRAGDPPGGHWQPLWSPDGTQVYFASSRNGPIDYWSVRVRDGLLTKRADNWTYHVRQLTTGPTGVSAWVVEWPLAGNRLVRIGVGDQPTGIPLAADVVVPSLPEAARAVSIAPGGRLAALVLIKPRQDVWTVPITNAGAPAGTPRRLRPGGHPAISPDGRRIAYDTGTEIRVMDIDGANDRPVLSGGRRVLYPTWQTDRRLFAMRRMGLSPYLVEADLETGVVTERLPLPEATTFPRVSPDGDTVVATLGEPLNTVGRGSLSRGTFGVWPLFDGYAFPVWSPDGRQLALEKKEGAHMPMYLGDVATGTARRVSPADGQFWPGAFSPDGRRIALSTLGDRGVWNIETLDPITGARTPVITEIDPEVTTRYPSWSPRGNLIAYDRTDVRGTLYLVELPPTSRTR